MARTSRDNGAAKRLCGAIRDICEALDVFEEVSEAPAISTIRAIRALGEGALKKHSEPGYSAAVAQPLAAPSRVGKPRDEPTRDREAARWRLFTLCTPKMILKPANTVAVFLHEHPMWKSWDWPETAAVNTRMLPFVQGLDVDDPLPDDARLALPLTVAGFMLYRALHVNPEGKPRDNPAVVMDVYGEIAQGIAIVDKCLTRAAQQRINGEVSEAFLGDLAHTTMVAETFLLHTVRLGPEMWDLILQCPLGAGCKVGEPYYVPRLNDKKPNGKKAYHPACRVGKLRTKNAQERVTLKRVPKKQ